MPQLKKDYLEGGGDSVDAVVVGAFLGRGRRAGRFGGFLLACYDPAAEQYQTLCKLGTGFSDHDLDTLTAQLQEHVIDAPRNYYRCATLCHRVDLFYKRTKLFIIHIFYTRIENRSNQCNTSVIW